MDNTGLRGSGFYHVRYAEMAGARQTWAEVALKRGLSRGIMPNGYAHLDIFNWLEENVGAVAEHRRSSKFAWGGHWAYTQDGDDRHIFFFADHNVAMRFRLTWA